MNGAYGEGPLAFDRLFEMLEKAAWSGVAVLLFLGAIWFISAVRR